MHIRKLGCSCVTITPGINVMTYNMFDHILYDGDAENAVDDIEALGAGYLCQRSRIIRNSVVQNCLPPERATLYAYGSCPSWWTQNFEENCSPFYRGQYRPTLDASSFEGIK